MILNQLSDNPGARVKRTRVGRGIGCTKGKTCGRGVKGQKSRTGVAIKGFEGGQMPIYRRLPKRGFTNINSRTLAEINLGALQAFIDAGKIDAKKPVNAEVLATVGVASCDGIKLLAKGEIKSKLTIVVDAASKKAIEMVEKAGGKVEVLAPKAETASA